MKLIKLKEKLILVSDEEIQIDDNYVAWETNHVAEPKERWVIYNRVSGLNGTNQKKIISEKPDFSLLSEADCKTIGYVNIEKLADDWNYNQTKEEFGKPHNAPSRIRAFIKGFNKAQSLNDKQFSLEDIKKAFDAGYDLNTWEQLEIPNEERDYLNEKDFIQSLQQTVWDVEVEMERKTLYAENGLNYTGDLKPKITNNSIKITKIL